MNQNKPVVLVLNGPNTNLLGERDPSLYGGATLPDVERVTRAHALARGMEIDFRQSNHEGQLIDWIHAARGKVAGAIINPAALTHTSMAIPDALRILGVPLVELHFANVYRDPAKVERQRSYVRPVATGVILGFGPGGYLLAVDAVHQQLFPPVFRQEQAS